MKRVRIFLTCLALAGLSTALAQPAALPADPRFDQTVSFSTGMGGESLAAMITALARSIGLTPVLDDFLDKTIVYDIGDAKPFRQVWDLVLTLNDLDYLLQENDVVVVGSTESLARLRAPDAPPTESDEPTVQRFYRVNNEVDQVVAILRRAVAGITVDPLPGTGALVVVGTQEQQDDVAAVLAEFDRPADVVPLEQRTYFLSNATASALAATLQATGVVATNDEEGAGAALIDGFTVVAEARTNSLIVTGTAAVQARLADLIAQLDEPQPQVNIQVRIQEITRRTALDLGVDWSGNYGSLVANVIGGGLNFIFDTTNVVSPLNLIPVLNALEAQGLSRRVDDGNLTVLNNGTAEIQTGGVLTIVPTNPNLDPEDFDYGVLISVTPRISASGMIILDVVAEVQGTPTTVDRSSGIEINRTTRNVSTTASVRPGETLLLGGVLSSSLEVSTQRIPILGSLPIIGGLFGTTVTEDDSTDLLVIVTAVILD